VLGLILKIILLPFIILTFGIVYFLINGLMLEAGFGVSAGVSRGWMYDSRGWFDSVDGCGLFAE